MQGDGAHLAADDLCLVTDDSMRETSFAGEERIQLEQNADFGIEGAFCQQVRDDVWLHVVREAYRE